MKNAFSIFEIIIVLVIIAMISGVATYKLFFSTNKANTLKIKTEVALIQQGLTQSYNRAILKGNESSYYAVLDDAQNNNKNEPLFSKILDFPIVSTSVAQSKIGYWIKQNNRVYEVVVSKHERLSFIYDDKKGTFECNMSKPLCKKLYQ
jgi:type II secretory pathway pseudopilin PulG